MPSVRRRPTKLVTGFRHGFEAPPNNFGGVFFFVDSVSESLYDATSRSKNPFTSEEIVVSCCTECGKPMPDAEARLWEECGACRGHFKYDTKVRRHLGHGASTGVFGAVVHRRRFEKDAASMTVNPETGGRFAFWDGRIVDDYSRVISGDAVAADRTRGG